METKKPAFLMKPPGKGRRSFQFLKRTHNPKRACGWDYEKVEDERVDALDEAYGAAITPEEQAAVIKQGKDFRATLYVEAKRDRREGESVFLSDNLKL